MVLNGYNINYVLHVFTVLGFPSAYNPKDFAVVVRQNTTTGVRLPVFVLFYVFLINHSLCNPHSLRCSELSIL